MTARLYENLVADDDEGVKNEDGSYRLNPNSLAVMRDCMVEKSLLEAKPYESFQFVRNGFFAVDPKDSTEGAPVFNRVVSLKSSYKPA